MVASENIKKFLLRKEQTGQKYDLHVTKSQNKVYEEYLGRKANLKSWSACRKTKYCTTCHIKHGIGKHNQ